MKRKTGVAAFTGIMLAAALTVMLVLAACQQLGEAEEPQKNLAMPYISIQPESRSLYTTDDISGLVLKVDVWEWEPSDGSISYQWYQFEDINEYCANGKGTEIGGATEKIYTPVITAEAGKKYYFYVMVTNTNSDALDKPTDFIQSEVATIAFSAPGDPLVPIIVRNPANASYGWGRSLNALKVEARLPRLDDGVAPGTITYQWYSNGERSTEGGTPEPEQNKASFIPGYDILHLNQNYFYVVVTNTLEGKTPAVAVSIPAIIRMDPGQRAATPRIERQPADRLFFTGKPIESLSVTAESPDMGLLSYQWYYNPATGNIEDTRWTSVDGATKDSFTPPAGTDGFYYVIVTNTNEGVVSDDKTAPLTSKAVQVRFAAPDSLTANATIKIPDFINKPENLRQYVRGYGGMHVAWDNFPALYAEDTELMYNPDKMGYNILRIMIRPDNIDIKETMEKMVNGSLRQFYQDYYKNVQIVNKYGGYVAASPWTPPKEWKSNNSINGGGNLIPSYYRLFATYLRTFAQLMYDNEAPIYCISISNEPNYVAGYDGCEWSPAEMRDFWVEIGHFTDGIRGYGGGKELPYVLTMNGESANTPYINREALKEPRSRAVIDLLARHIYGSRKDSLYNNAADKATLVRPDGSLTEVWMTEHNINSANATGYYNDSTWPYVWRYLNDVDLVMRLNNENAFVWWASKRFYSMVGDGQFGTTEHAPLPRGWALSHYARYTIDTTRIHLPDTNCITGTIKNAAGADVTINAINRGNSVINNDIDDMDNKTVRITAYVSQDGNEISMVIWTPTLYNGNDGYDLGTVKIDFADVPGFEIKGVKAHRSRGQLASEIFQQDDSVIVSEDRKSAYVTVPRSQILSVKFSK